MKKFEDDVMVRRILLSITLFSSCFCAATIGADNTAIPSLTDADQANHVNFKKIMSPEQVKMISDTYPDFRILKLCAGHFSGQKQDEFVLGIWKPVESISGMKIDVHRIGLLWSGDGWKIHNIDDEIKMNQDMDKPSPGAWEYSFRNGSFAGEMICGIESEFREGSNLTYGLGDKPQFNLKKSGLENNKVSCFATSDVYNNWDCVVYSPKDNRFKLWFQQAHAD